MPNFTYILNNCSIGAVGDNSTGTFNSPQTQGMTSLQRAITTIQGMVNETEELQEFIEDLVEYTTVRPRKVIGLENKLIEGNRQDLIEDAKLLKNRFERKLAKSQMILSEQMVYVHVLAFICTVFKSKVVPLIREGHSPSIIDSTIYEEIIDEVYTALSLYNNTFTTELIRGMLYYLTGKCHLVWS